MAVAAAGVVSGCSTGGGAAADGSESSGPAPGTVESARAARESAALVARYDAVAAAHPSLAARLAPLRAEVARHVEAFGGKPPAPAAAAGPEQSPAAALTALAAAERKLADRRAVALLTVPGDLARLMASVAAAGAGHVVLLNSGAKNT